MNLIRRIRRKVGRLVGGFDFDEEFFTRLIAHTDNFNNTKWLGRPIWQNLLDLWTIQETIAELRPALLIETGTNRGGSSYFFGQLFDLMGHGKVVTVDVERLHDLAHPRVTYLLGNSTGEAILSQVRIAVGKVDGPIMVILDSDHSEAHVRHELQAYAPFVTPGSYLNVQDGIIDILPMFSSARPGPLPAIEAFIRDHPEFELDEQRCNRFLLTHHPKGWLRRRAD